MGRNLIIPEEMDPLFGSVEPIAARRLREQERLNGPVSRSTSVDPSGGGGGSMNEVANTAPGPFDHFNNAMGQFDSAMNTGAGYLSDGIGALARPINSVIGAAMKPVGSILETAMSPVNAIFGSLNESPLGQMAAGFGQ